MSAKKDEPKKLLVFTIEYSIDIDEAMELNLSEIIDKMREGGGARIAKVEIR